MAVDKVAVSDRIPSTSNFGHAQRILAEEEERERKRVEREEARIAAFTAHR
jgi:hypothetical protein